MTLALVSDIRFIGAGVACRERHAMIGRQKQKREKYSSPCEDLTSAVPRVWVVDAFFAAGPRFSGPLSPHGPGVSVNVWTDNYGISQWTDNYGVSQ